MAMMMQNTFNGGELSPQVFLRVDQNKYPTAVQRMQNMLPLVQGPVMRRPGMQFCGESGDGTHRVRVIDFVFNETQAYVLEFGHQYMRVWFNGGLVIKDGSPLQVVTPYTENDIFDLSYSQSGDIMYICHHSFPIKRIERHAHDDWRIADPVIGSSQPPPAKPTLVKSGDTGRTYSYVVTAVNDETGEESIASEAATIDASNTLSTTNFVTISVPEIAGATLYNFYKDMTSSGVHGYIGSAAPEGGNAKIVDRGANPASDDTPPKARNPFENAGDYPSSVAFFQQRLCFGGSDNKPQTIYMSQTANFQNFNVSDPVKDDDAVTFTLASGRINRIKWLVGSRTLLVGTIGGEWSVRGVDDAPITPTSIDAQEVSNVGVTGINPIQMAGRAMFVQGDGRTIREMTYDFASDTYIPKDQTVYAEHLFSGKRIIDWCFQRSPYNTFWVVLDDGTMAAYTYVLEHGSAGWSRHDTDGIVESTCAIPNGDHDEVYVVVRRTVESVERRYIERMVPYHVDTLFKDCTLADSYGVVVAPDGQTYTTVTGLEHINGKEAVVLADGAVVPPQVVIDGKVVVPRPSKKIMVGLGYKSVLVPLCAEMNTNEGGSLLLSRIINGFYVYLYNMSGGLWGIEGSDNMYEMATRDGGSTASVELDSFTGVQKFQLVGNVSTRATFRMQQEDPLPFNIFALNVNVEVGTR